MLTHFTRIVAQRYPYRCWILDVENAHVCTRERARHGAHHVQLDGDERCEGEESVHSLRGLEEQ